MSILKRQTVKIPVAEVSGIDELFGRMMNIDMENIPAKFQKPFNQTRELAYRHFTMECLFESYEIESMDKGSIRLKNGILLESELLPDVFARSFELGFIVATLSGYDELDAAEDNMLTKLFLDNWGTAFIECADKWAIQFIAKNLENQNLFVTHSFSPGQNNIPIEMQTLIFDTLDPGAIGVTLSDRFMMHPKKSVSGIFGIQREKDERSIRPCDLCERRDNCPTAYA
ncbi:MAG: hypothetical protein ACOX4J_04010 [Anaerovoracaceae bacterium]|jgi:hypothetical protein